MMTSHSGEPPFRYYEPPGPNGYAVAWTKLRNMTRVLHFKWQLRSVHVLATRCGTCVSRPGRMHRPCYALGCQCPCSTDPGPIHATVMPCLPQAPVHLCGQVSAQASAHASYS